MYKLKKKVLKMTSSDGRSIVYFILKEKKHTPLPHCVEYKDYYEISGYSGYCRIDKKTMTVTSNMKNAEVFEVEEGVKAEIVKLKDV